MLKAMLVFSLFILGLILLSIMQKNDLKFQDASTYIVIAVVILTLITVLAALCYACSVKIHNRLNARIIDDHVSRIDEPSTGAPTITSRPTMTLNQDILRMMQRLSQFPDYVFRTLPTYNKAMFSSAPFRVRKTESIDQQQQQQPPPEYVTVTSPPINTADDPAPPSYHNTLNGNAARVAFQLPAGPSSSAYSVPNHP